jgi:hypothetical protein
MSTSIREAMQRALRTPRIAIPQEWDDQPSQQPKPQEKQMQPAAQPDTQRNCIRETFHFIQNNPHHTKREIVQIMTNSGHNEGTAAANVSQLIRSRNVMADANGRLKAYFPEYDPSKVTNLTGKHPGKRKSPKAAAQKQVQKPVQQPVQEKPVQSGSTEQLLERLSIVQARQLYDALKQIFGGAQ